MKKPFVYLTLVFLSLAFFSCGPAEEKKTETHVYDPATEEKQFETAFQFMMDLQTDKALPILQEIAREGKQKERAYCGIGGCYLQKQQPEKALKAYEDALKLDPHYYDALLGEASAYLDMKNYGKALESFAQARQEQPAYLDSYRGLAIVYDRLNMPDSALANARISLANDPDAKTDYDLQQIVKKYEHSEESKKH